MPKEVKDSIPEIEAISIESENYIKRLEVSKGKAFEIVCHNWVCNKNLEDFYNNDTDGGLEFGIDSVNIEKLEDGGMEIKIISCKFSKGFSYKQVDEIGKGLKILFDDDNFRKIKNKKLKDKIIEIRKNKQKVRDVKVYYCVNNSISLVDDECLKSKSKTLKELVDIFGAKYKKGINVDFLFFDAKSLYEKKIRNDNSISKKNDIFLKYKKSINKFNKNKEVSFSEGKIEGCIITVEAVELKKLLEKCGDDIFNYNIRKFKGKNSINKGIERTINSKTKNNFWFLNNGITLVCEQAIEKKDGIIKLKYPQIVNGQQTLKTIELFQNSYLVGVDVLIRLYITDNEKFFTEIALATNSQTRIDFSDISSNKSEQHAIKYLFEHFGYFYKNKKGVGKKIFKNGIDSKTLGRISMSTINRRPGEGRRTIKDSDIFGEKNYSILFGRNPYFLLLSFLIYNYCKEVDVKNKISKKITQIMEIKHFGYFHLSSLIWHYIENDGKLVNLKDVIILIKGNNFEEYYKKSLSKINSIVTKETIKDKSIVLKDYFNSDNFSKLIFKK